MIAKQWSILASACVATMAALPSVAQQLPLACAPGSGCVVECINPSATDPAIRRFDSPHYILFNANSGPAANLLVFLPGTGGEPPGLVRFLKAAVAKVLEVAKGHTRDS